MCIYDVNILTLKNLKKKNVFIETKVMYHSKRANEGLKTFLKNDISLYEFAF